MAFKKASDADFFVDLLVDGKKINGVLCNEHQANEMISRIDDPAELITLLKSLGESTTEMANVIESNLGPDLDSLYS